jgi:hypothetical protein
MEVPLGRPVRSFATTHWTDVFAAAGKAGTRSSEALDRILRLYQTPLRIYLKRRFHLTDDDASDALHSFIERKVLQRSFLAHADPERGRFRTFLIRALDRFVVSEHRRETSLKRSPDGAVLSLNELSDRDDLLPQVGCHEAEFAWARTVIDKALGEMKRECEDKGRLDVWTVFEGRLLRPLLENAAPMPYKDLVRSCKLESPARAFNVLLTAKRMFQRNLLDAVGEYTTDRAAAEKELCELRAVLMHL